MSPSFLSSTSDSRTARLATSRCSREPIAPAQAAELNGLPNSPSLSFIFRMRVTASSILAIGTSPASTRRIISASPLFQDLTSMNMSMPASRDCR